MVRTDQPETQFDIDLEDGFCIYNAAIAGTPTDLCFRWRNETQDFVVESIAPSLP